MIFKNDDAVTTVTVEELRADAEKKAAQLRAIAADFISDNDKTPLTVEERRLAAGTPVQFLERGAVILDTAPTLSGAPPSATVVLRMAAEAELAYTTAIASSEEVTRQMKSGLLRVKLRAVRIARDVYRVANGYAETEEGERLKPHVESMKTARRRPRRKKPETPPDTEPET